MLNNKKKMVIKSKTKTKRGKKFFRRASEAYWWEVFTAL